MTNLDAIGKAVDLIKQADSLLITAGAGMGVDSSLPDFRGDQGFWKAYPALGRKSLGFRDMANPDTFSDNPQLAWGFYGHRLQLYRDTVPHDGFRILRAIGSTKPLGAFVYTSNVDGQFQKAGFSESELAECHGSIHHLQCLQACSPTIWPADDLSVDIDLDACELRSPLPACPRCGGLARPNILMFSDWSWLSDRTDLQEDRYQSWIREVLNPVVIEIGAGTDLPTIRRRGECLSAPMVRGNPTDAEVIGSKSVGLRMGALDALQKIAMQMGLS